MTEAPTDKSTVFQASLSALDYHHLDHHVVHCNQCVVPNDDYDDDSRRSVNISISHFIIIIMITMLLIMIIVLLIMMIMMMTQAGLRTLHEAGPELQRTISTDLEVGLHRTLS